MSLPSFVLRSGVLCASPTPSHLSLPHGSSGDERKGRGLPDQLAPQNSSSKYCGYFIPCGPRDEMKAMSSTQTLPNLIGSTYEFSVIEQCKSYMCSVGIVFLILIFYVYLFFIAIRSQFLQPSNIDRRPAAMQKFSRL